MSLDPSDGWRPDGSGNCPGCDGPTVCGLVAGERRLPVCPSCAALLRERPAMKELILARALGAAPS